MDLASVRATLPHRYPLLLVDAVRELVEGERIVAVKAVTANEPWYSRIPDDADAADLSYPPVLLLESWAQAAGILVGAGGSDSPLRSDTVMLFGSASKVTYLRPVLPGQILTHEVRLGKRLPDAVLVTGETTVDGSVVLTVDQGLMAFRPRAALLPTT